MLGDLGGQLAKFTFAAAAEPSDVPENPSASGITAGSFVGSDGLT